MRINSISSQYSYNNYKKGNSNKGITNADTRNNQPSFKGAVPKPIVNGLTKFYEKTANLELFQKAIAKFSRSDKTFTHVMVMESCFLSGFYMINTLRNKNIKEEQKPQMLINDAMTLGISTAGAYLVEDNISNMVTKGAEKYFAKHADFYTKLGQKAAEKSKGNLLNKVAGVFSKENTIDDVISSIGSHLGGIIGEKGKEKAFQITDDAAAAIKSSVKDAINANKDDVIKAQEAVKGLVDDAYNKVAARAEADNIMPGINKLKVLIIFGIIYRYLGPVVITPIANKISSKFFDKKKTDTKETQEKK